MSNLEQENTQLREQLQAALKFVQLVAEDWWVADEMYHQCFFCSEPEPEDVYHKKDCPVLEAKKFLAETMPH